MKRFIWIFSIISMFTFTNCGGGSDSKEAKELLQKILQVVGIPYDIVVNICQDDNKNGICENFELQAKVILSKGDSFEDIINKIQLTDDGKYFLETRDPTKPILLELQDTQNVKFDNGKFTIPFNGFKTYENNETKELSILASMVDKGYFQDSSLEAIRNLENGETQDRFYSKLLKALEDNINTLRGAGLDPKNSVLASLKEMSVGLKADGVENRLPEDLNRCGDDMTCVDARLENTYIKITITPTKAETIKEEYGISTTPATTSTSGKKLLISKEIEYSKANYGGERDDETTTITEYKYNSNNQLIQTVTKTDDISFTFSYTSEETCNLIYSGNRFIKEECEEISKNKNTGEEEIYRDITEVEYLGDMPYKYYYYYNGELSSIYEVLERDSDKKPIKIKLTSVDKEEEIGETTWIYKITYDSNSNPVLIEWVYSNDRYNDEWKIERKFDNKKSPYYYNNLFQTNYFMWGWYGKNNIIEEIETYKREDFSSITTTKNRLEYNSYDMPTKIEGLTTGNSYREETTTTYEYIEAR